MKDLKQLNNKQGSMINDLQILKGSNKTNLQGSMVNSQQPSAMQTQRHGSYAP